MMRAIFGGTGGTVAGAALVALTLAGVSWPATGQEGRTGVTGPGVRPLAGAVEYPPKDPCRDPINGWQGGPACTKG
ncbi:hypothetical protein [Streptomyces sp. HB132]|uniref:hypothetical protein n=1 Tax=Streptomyces sp. HB132 TaxID=767388 RepID=UPI001960DD0B|nr:hypothetical protein [Streptomyces sp. HB132]MBM7437310.1 hypothetical protein [Streptomyces sp. HB132]